METSLNILFFISRHSGNPKFPNPVTLPDIKNAELIFVVFSKYGGYKTSGFSERVQITFEGWNLENNWKSENIFKSLK